MSATAVNRAVKGLFRVENPDFALAMASFV
jgi:hypothetical protein